MTGAEIGPLANKAGAAHAGLSPRARVAEDILSRVCGQHHLSSGAKGVPKAVPPVREEILPFVDKDGVVTRGELVGVVLDCTGDGMGQLDTKHSVARVLAPKRLVLGPPSGIGHHAS